MSSEEFERVLNFLKIDYNNYIKLLGMEDIEIEMIANDVTAAPLP